MKKIEFEISIDAPAAKVWSILWSAEGYPQWTIPFSPASRIESSWLTGSRVFFLDENNVGLIGIIVDQTLNTWMDFKLIGIFNDGKEDLDSDEVMAWAGNHETFNLKQVSDGVQLCVGLETKGFPDDLVSYFSSTWPKALQCLKELSEGVLVKHA